MRSNDHSHPPPDDGSPSGESRRRLFPPPSSVDPDSTNLPEVDFQVWLDLPDGRIDARPLAEVDEGAEAFGCMPRPRPEQIAGFVEPAPVVSGRAAAPTIVFTPYGPFLVRTCGCLDLVTERENRQLGFTGTHCPECRPTPPPPPPPRPDGSSPPSPREFDSEGGAR